MPQIWKNLTSDPQVILRELEQNDDFRQFVENTLPRLLQEILGKTLTLETLMEAQFLCVESLGKVNSIAFKKIKKIQRSLSQYTDAKFFLETLGIAEAAYWQQRPGLSDNEYEQVQNGEWTVLYLLEQRPALVLAPVLRPTSHNN